MRPRLVPPYERGYLPNYSDRRSNLIYRLGFGCSLEEEGYRIGPFAKSDMVTEEHVTEAYRYMARVWVEASLALRAYIDIFSESIEVF